MTIYSMTDDPADYTDALDDFDYAPDTSIETADDIEWQASAALRERMQDAGDRLLEAIESEAQ